MLKNWRTKNLEMKTKAERKQWQQGIEKVLVEAGASIVEDTEVFVSYNLDTLLGEMEAYVSRDEYADVLCRFTDIGKAREALCDSLIFNRHSGKWNHCYFMTDDSSERDRHEEIDCFIGDFARSLSTVLHQIDIKDLSDTINVHSEGAPKLKASPLLIDLKPCPCCGSELIQATAASAAAYHIKCLDCGIRSAPVDVASAQVQRVVRELGIEVTPDNRDRLIVYACISVAAKHWNRRPS